MRFLAEDRNRSAARVWEPLSAQFVALLGVIVVAPLPLAGNRPWALALLGALIMGILMWNLWAPELRVTPAEENNHRARWQRARLPLYLMGAWVALLALQLVPLPSSLVSALDFSHVAGFPFFSGEWTTLSIDPYSTRLYLLKALVLLAFFWLLLRLTTTPARVELLVKTIVLCGFVQATIGVILFAWAANYSLFFVQVEHFNAKGTFISRNHFAGYLEMTLAMGIGLMIAKLENYRPHTWKQRITRWLAVVMNEKARLRIMLIVMVIGLIASRSRMGNAAFFFSLLIVGTIAIVLSKRATRATVIFITSLVVLDIVIMGSVVGVEKVMQRIEDTNLRNREPVVIESGANRQGGLESRKPGAQVASLDKEESVETRIEAGRRAAVILKDFPILGAGGGSFHIAFVPYQPFELRGYFDHAHNDFVEFGVETGAVGLFLLAAIVLASLFHALRILLLRRNRFARGMAFASLMGMVALMIHSFVDFNLQILANGMLFVVILTLPYLVGSRPGSNQRV